MANVVIDSPPPHWLTRIAISEPPVDWLIRVQQNAPDLLEQTKSPGQNVLMPTHPLPTDDFPHAEVGVEPIQGKHPHRRPHPSTRNETTNQIPQTLAEVGSPYTPRVAQRVLLQQQPGLRASFSAFLVRENGEMDDPPSNNPLRHQDDNQRQFLASSEPDKANVETEQDDIFRLGARFLASTVPDRAAQTTNDLWPSFPTDEYETIHPAQDWEMARRHWQRRQRLEEEQRGRSWNA